MGIKTRHHLGDEGEHANGREANHQLRDFHHHFKHTLPEIELRLCIRLGNARHEKPKQQAENN